MNPSPYPAPFNSAHGRASIVKILLIACAIVAGVSLFAETLSLAFPITDDQELDDNPIGALVMLIVFLVGLFQTMLYLTTVVFFAVWLYRANGNLRAFNPWARPEHSSGWAVGSFFVPFINLVVPYRAVKEVWQKSGTPDESLLAAPSPPGWFPAWWAFWLLAGFSGNISLRLSFNENISLSTATIVSIIANALFVVASVFAYFVVDAIDKRQEETIAKLKLGRFAGPPPPPADLARSDVLAPTASSVSSQQSG